MKNRTDDRLQVVQPEHCDAFGWCEETEEHTEHHFAPDLPMVVATGNRDDYVARSSGVQVPRVAVSLYADTRPSCEVDDAPLVILSVIRPGDASEAWVYLTVAEADFLRRHLVQVVEAARS